MPDALVPLLILATIAGWHTARFLRARSDLAGAKDGVTKARQILSVERKAFLLVAAIVFLVIWWWLDSHS
jgi:hypothetical protein